MIILNVPPRVYPNCSIDKIGHSETLLLGDSMAGTGEVVVVSNTVIDSDWLHRRSLNMFQSW